MPQQGSAWYDPLSSVDAINICQDSHAIQHRQPRSLWALWRLYVCIAKINVSSITPHTHEVVDSYVVKAVYPSQAQLNEAKESSYDMLLIPLPIKGVLQCLTLFIHGNICFRS